MTAKTLLAIFLIIVIVVGIVAGILVILKNSDSQSTEEKMISLYIEAEDEATEEKVETDFVVVSNNTVQVSGRTNTKGFEEIKIRESLLSLNVYVLNYGGEYYVNQHTYIGNSGTLTLYRKGEPTIELTEFNDTNLKYRIGVKGGQYRQLGFCLKWSGNFLDVTSNTFTEIIPPQRLEGRVDKCYYTLITIVDNETLDINLNYRLISDLSSYDELYIVLFDSDRNYLNQYTFEGENGEDVGSEDRVFIFPTRCTGDKCYLVNAECHKNYCTT